jgi:hypothetical protein
VGAWGGPSRVPRYWDEFSKARSDELPPFRQAGDHKTEPTEDGRSEDLGYCPLYKLSCRELEALFQVTRVGADLTLKLVPEPHHSIGLHTGNEYLYGCATNDVGTGPAPQFEPNLSIGTRTQGGHLYGCAMMLVGLGAEPVSGLLLLEFYLLSSKPSSSVAVQTVPSTSTMDSSRPVWPRGQHPPSWRRSMVAGYASA